jgi:hypothetical protein
MFVWKLAMNFNRYAHAREKKPRKVMPKAHGNLILIIFGSIREQACKKTNQQMCSKWS